jgi:hypothetical protein
MIKTEEKKIDDLDVAVTQFPARFGFKMQARLLKVFGPVIGKMLSGADLNNVKQGLDTDIKLDMLADAIELLFKSMDEDSAMKLVMDLLQSTRIGGQEINDVTFDNIFPGKYSTLFKVIGYVLEVNFGSFLGGSSIGKMVKSAVLTK